MKKSAAVSKSFFSSLFSSASFLLIVALCVASSLVIVFPFWFFADRFPTAYSFFILALILALCVTMIVFAFIRKFRGKNEDEKKVLRHNLWRSLVIFIFVAIGIVVPVIFVLSYNRIIALVLFLISFVALGVFSSCVKKR